MARGGLIFLPIKIPVRHRPAEGASEREELFVMGRMIGIARVIHGQLPNDGTG